MLSLLWRGVYALVFISRPCSMANDHLCTLNTLTISITIALYFLVIPSFSVLIQFHFSILSFTHTQARAWQAEHPASNADRIRELTDQCATLSEQRAVQQHEMQVCV